MFWKKVRKQISKIRSRNFGQDQIAIGHVLVVEWSKCRQLPWCKVSAVADAVLRGSKGQVLAEILEPWSPSTRGPLSTPAGFWQGSFNQIQGSDKVLGSNRFRDTNWFWQGSGLKQVLDINAGPPPACPSPQWGHTERWHCLLFRWSLRCGILVEARSSCQGAPVTNIHFLRQTKTKSACE